MGRNKLVFGVILFLALGLFCVGLGKLMVARFESGDVYPPYSSYSRDPAGTRALYESLASLQGVAVSRNTIDYVIDPGSPAKTVFIVGLSRESFRRVDEESMKQLDAWLQAGDRLVIAFLPSETRRTRPAVKIPPVEKGKAPDKEGAKNTPEKQDDPGKGVKKPAPDNGTKPEDRASLQPPLKDLGTEWAVDFEDSAESEGTAELKSDAPGLPRTIGWRSGLAFRLSGPVWKTVYAKHERPVLIERALSNGTVVLITDPFLFTNEAMKDRRAPGLLAWLCGSHDRFVFDETHLGIVERPNVATLIKRNGLAPFFGSLILIALLAIWRQMVPMLPIPKSGPGAHAGRGYLEGMANLLRVSIPEERILDVCVDEWERAFAHEKGGRAGLATEARRLAAQNSARPKRQRNPRAAYDKITEMMDKDKRLSGRI